jgi:phage FluMu gp28-like protein
MSKTVSKTFRLQRESVEAMEDLVRSGRAITQTALVEMLVSREKARLDFEREEQILDAAWKKAMESPEYRLEMSQIELEFVSADAEVARSIQ